MRCDLMRRSPRSLRTCCAGRWTVILYMVFIAGALQIGLLFGATVSASDELTELIFSPCDPIPRHIPNGRVTSGSLDYQQLFTPSAPWTEAASHIAVFKLYPQFVMKATVDDLRMVIQDLNRRGIAIGLEAGALIPTATYGSGVEGFGGERGVVMAERIKELGGKLTFLNMDEPYTFGCRYAGPHAASMSMEQVAHEIIDYIHNMKAIFPDVSIGDTEGLGGGLHITVSDFEAWLEAYRQANGAPFPFVLVDSPWDHVGAFADVHKLQSWIQSHGMKCGVFFNGDYQDTSDAAWLAHAEDAYSQYERVGERRPDLILMQSWNDRPKAVLPESSPLSYTHLINGYFRAATAINLQAHFQQQDHVCRISGSVAGEHGIPVRSVNVMLEREALEGPGEMTTWSIAGEVPQGAVTANVGMRINNEGATSGPCELIVSEMRFDQGSDSLVPKGDFREGIRGWNLGNSGIAILEDAPGRGLHIRASATQSTAVNSQPFSVKACVPYHFTVTAQVAPSAADHGYFDLIFFLADGHEMLRQKIPFTPARITLGSVVTQPDGTFSFSQPSAAAGSCRIFARFEGDLHWRPSRSFCLMDQ